MNLLPEVEAVQMRITSPDQKMVVNLSLKLILRLEVAT